MKKIAIFSLNAQCRVGGTEVCIKRMVDLLSANYDVTVVSGDLYGHQSKSKYSYSNIELIKIPTIKYFTYLHNVIVYYFVQNFFKTKSFDIVIANGRFASGALFHQNKSNKPGVYYFHDEYSFNRRAEYSHPNTLIKKAFRVVRRFIDYPFFKLHSYLNSLAIMNAKRVFANSRFIASEIEAQENVKADVIYPFTKTINNKLVDTSKAEYITMVGSGGVKGIDVFEKVAKLLPELKFRIVGQGFKERCLDNICYSPFYSDPEDLYKSTSMLLVPSKWLEAFGKVSVEAGSRGIPVIVSDRGGLPETVCSSEFVIKDYDNPVSWKNKIISLLENGFDSTTIINHASKFDELNDLKKIDEIIESLLECQDE